MKTELNTYFITGNRRGFFLLLLMICCALPLKGTDLLTFPQRNPEAVIRLDMQKIYKTLQGKTSDALSRKQFHDLIGPASDILDMNKHCSEVLVSVYSLRRSRCIIFCKTSLQEKDFKALLQKMKTNTKITARTCGKSILYRITGGKMADKPLFAAYLKDGVVLFSGRDLSWYLLSKTPKGLTEEQRSYLKMQYPISGYAIPDRKFYKRNLFLPRFRRIIYSIAIQKDSSLIFRMEGPLESTEDAEMKMQQIQQTRMMCAMLLNNVDPSLAEEFMRNGKVYRQNSTLFVYQYLSAAFLKTFFLRGIPMLMPAQQRGPLPANGAKRKGNLP